MRKRRAAAQPDRRRVDRFLPERPEALALKRGAAVPDVAAGEERLEAIVGGAREQHAAEDLAPFVGRQRRFDRGAAQKTVAGVDELGVRLADARAGGDARRRVGEAGRQRPRAQAPRQLAAQGLTQRVY